MSSSLGEKLRQAREERGISISEVAEQTRISSLYLKSIEDDNYKPLPGGIFNKGFVKAYAKYVGLDEQEALGDYARLVAKHDEVNEGEQPRYRPEVLTDEARTASSMAPTIVFAGIILALMTGGILFVVNYIQNRPDDPGGSNTASNNRANVTANNDVANSNTVPATPAPDEIRVEFRALSEKVSVTSTVDGSVAYDEVLPEAPKVYTAQQGLKLKYYRGFSDKVQITLNGKVLSAPPAPAKGKNIEFEINKENIARILESGQAVESAPVPTATVASTSQPTPAPSQASTPSAAPANTAGGSNATPPRPALTPQPTPRRSPTPIIVGRPPTARPTPN